MERARELGVEAGGSENRPDVLDVPHHHALVENFVAVIDIHPVNRRDGFRDCWPWNGKVVMAD